MAADILQLNRRSLLWILAAALLIRFLCSGLDPVATVDSGAYLLSAKALMSGNWADFFVERTPGYPLFMIKHLTLLDWLYGAYPESLLYQAIYLSQSVLGILLAVLVADLACRLFNNQYLGLAAGLLTAVSPSLLQYEHTMLTETLYALSLTFYAWTLIRFRETTRPWMLPVWGGVAGWLLWIKPLAMIVPAVTLLFLWKNGFTKKQLALYLAPVTVFYLGWSAFQYQTHGIFSLGTGGATNQLYKVIDFIDLESPVEREYKMLLAQRRQVYPPKMTYEAVNDAHVLRWRAELPNKPSWQIYLEDEAKARNIAMEAIRQRPLQYAWVTVQSFWKTLTAPTGWDPHTLFWIPVLLLSTLGILLCWADNRSYGFPLLIAALAWSHLLVSPVLSVGDPRYRVPQEPILILFAAYAASRLISTARQQKTSG